MGGEIDVRSEPGRGSSFRVSLPAIPRAQLADAAEAPDAMRLQDLPPLRVLVVDDIELNRRLIEDWFAPTHHSLRSANGGLDGVAQAATFRPDVVLMDLRMPDLDGRTALDRLRAMPELATTKVLAVTASSMLGDEGELRRHFDGYLRKPVRRDDLCAAIATAIGHASTASAQTPDAANTHENATTEPADDATRAVVQRTLPGLCAAVNRALATLSTDDLDAVLDQLQAPVDPPLPLAVRTLARQLQSAQQRFDIVGSETRLRELRTWLDDSGSTEHTT
jgi:CheY-like chemotaxis protein